MISLEQQVVSLKLAKRLKELEVGVETLGQVAFWHWYYDDTHKKWEVGWYGSDDLIRSSKPTYAAFTVAELGELLPDQVSSWRTGIKWICSHDELTVTGDAIPDQRADTEADTRAKILIYLVENKIWTLDSLKEV
jgi:hypothetical protein